MPQFDPELIQVMRSVLDDVMGSVPMEISGTTAKAYLAEVILRAAAQGQTSYSDLIAAATDQIHALTLLLKLVVHAGVVLAERTYTNDTYADCPFVSQAVIFSERDGSSKGYHPGKDEIRP